MENKSFVDRFFEFETKNRLFSLKDKNGVVVWDVIRFYVFSYISWGKSAQSSLVKKKSLSSITYKLKRVFSSFIYYFFHRKCDYYCIIASRDVKNGSSYDRNSDSIISLLRKQGICFIEDTLLTPESLDYKYKGKTMFSLFFLSRIINKRKRFDYDFGSIIELVNAEFGETLVSQENLIQIYKHFYQQYFYYKFILARKKPKKIFVVLNKSFKGLYLAAKERNIPVYEIQHGEISRPHLMYSYPFNEIDGFIYSPNYVLTYGSFWGKDCKYPGTKFCSVGNDEFVKINQINNKKKTSVLVISADIYREPLSNFVLDLSSRMHQCIFNYKLHPNEFADVAYYKSVFKNSNNIVVYTNEKSIPDLLGESAYIFLVQSTVEFEALAAGVKVISWEHQDYWSLDCLWNEPGVFLVKDAEEFVSTYREHINDTIEPRVDFFEPFDSNKLKTIFKNE